MTGILGNSKCVKLAQHHLVLTACSGFSGNQEAAKRHMKIVWEILDNIKINKDLFVDMYSAAIYVGKTFQVTE